MFNKNKWQKARRDKQKTPCQPIKAQTETKSPKKPAERYKVSWEEGVKSEGFGEEYNRFAQVALQLGMPRLGEYGKPSTLPTVVYPLSILRSRISVQR